MLNTLQYIEYGVTHALLTLETKANQALQNEDVQDWLKAVAIALVVLLLMSAAGYAFASDGTEFQSASQTFEGYAKGNPGKIAAVLGVLWGSAQAMFRKDLGAFVMPAGMGVGVGAILGVIDSTYTATF